MPNSRRVYEEQKSNQSHAIANQAAATILLAIGNYMRIPKQDLEKILDRTRFVFTTNPGSSSTNLIDGMFYIELADATTVAVKYLVNAITSELGHVTHYAYGVSGLQPAIAEAYDKLFNLIFENLTSGDISKRLNNINRAAHLAQEWLSFSDKYLRDITGEEDPDIKVLREASGDTREEFADFQSVWPGQKIFSIFARRSNLSESDLRDLANDLDRSFNHLMGDYILQRVLESHNFDVRAVAATFGSALMDHGSIDFTDPRKFADGLNERRQRENPNLKAVIASGDSPKIDFSELFNKNDEIVEILEKGKSDHPIFTSRGLNQSEIAIGAHATVEVVTRQRNMQSGNNLRAELRIAPMPNLNAVERAGLMQAAQEFLIALRNPRRITAITPDEISAGQYSYQFARNGDGEHVIKIADFGSAEKAMTPGSVFKELGTIPVQDAKSLKIAMQFWQLLVLGHELAQGDPRLARNPIGLAEAVKDHIRVVLRDHVASGVSPPTTKQAKEEKTQPQAKVPKPPQTTPRQRVTVQEAFQDYDRMKRINANALSAKAQLERMSESEKLKLIIRTALGKDSSYEPTAEETRAFWRSRIGVQKTWDMPTIGNIMKEHNILNFELGYLEVPMTAILLMRERGVMSPHALAFTNDPERYGPIMLQGGEQNFFRSSGSILYAFDAPLDAMTQAFHEMLHLREGGKTQFPFVERSIYEMEFLEELSNYRTANINSDGTIKLSYRNGDVQIILTYLRDLRKKLEHANYPESEIEMISGMIRKKVPEAVDAIKRLDQLLPARDVTHILFRARSLQEIIDYGKMGDDELIELFRHGFTREELERARRVGYDPRQKAIADIDQAARERDYLRHDFAKRTPESNQNWANLWAYGHVGDLLKTGGRSELRLIEQWLQSEDEILVRGVKWAFDKIGVRGDQFQNLLRGRSELKEATPTAARPQETTEPINKTRAEMRGLVHKNRENIDLTLPEDRFGAKVNLVEILESVATRVLGHTPLVSVTGSMSYAFTKEGRPDWDRIDDFDLRIHEDWKDKYYDQQRILTAFEEELKRISGLTVLPLTVAGGRMPPRMLGVNMNVVIKDKAKSQSHPVHVIFSDLKGLLNDKESGGLNVYKVTDLFFGNTSTLDAILSAAGLDAVVRENASAYVDLLTGIEPSGRYQKVFKTFYQLSVLRGKENSLRWLLDAFSKTNMGAREFDELYQKALSQLGVESALDQNLIEDLKAMIETRARSEMRIAATEESVATTAINRHIRNIASALIEWWMKGSENEVEVSELQALFQSGMSAVEVGRAVAKSVIRHASQNKRKELNRIHRNRQEIISRLANRLGGMTKEEIASFSAQDIWLAFVQAAGLTDIGLPEDNQAFEAWVAQVERTVQLSVSVETTPEAASLEFANVTKESMAKADQILAVIKNTNQKTLLEFRLPSNIPDANRGDFLRELLQTARNIAILNSFVSVRIVVSKETEASELKRIRDVMANQKDFKSGMMARGQVSIVSSRSLTYETDQATIAVTSNPAEFAGKDVPVFAIDYYTADHAEMKYEEGKVTPAKQLIGGLHIGSSGDSKEWQVADKTNPNVHRAITEEQFLAMALQIVIKQLAIDAQAKLLQSRAA